MQIPISAARAISYGEMRGHHMGWLLTNFAPLLAEVVFVRQIYDLLQIRKL